MSNHRSDISAYSRFVPLRIFSCFTMLEGAISPANIALAARKRGFPAIAVADRNGLYGALPFGEACKDSGIQPIIATMLSIARPANLATKTSNDIADNPNAPAIETDKHGAPIIDWLALYAQDERGYQNLCCLVSAAHLDRPLNQDPHVSLDFLRGKTEGLLCLTAGAEGALAKLYQQGQATAADSYLDQLQQLFADRLYIELSRRDNAVEQAAEAALIACADDKDIPLVATNPTCFVEPDFHSAHDVMMCIAQSSYLDSDDRRKSCPNAWLKPAATMAQDFADLPEAIDNSLVVAERCAFMVPRRDPILPAFSVFAAADGEDSAGSTDSTDSTDSASGADENEETALLRRDAQSGLDERLASYPDLSSEQRSAYQHRLEFELEVIIQMGFAGYFLIVADFIKWAKAQDVPVGPGRGSGAGSVVAWALTITDLDPLKLGLLFERFLNPERVSMPDFDIDFCETRRGEVIRYVQEKYGRDTVAQIITFGTLKARAVLKDTGRVMQMSYGHVDRLAKLIPSHPTDPWTLSRALQGVERLKEEYDQDAQVRRLFDMAQQIEGLPRHSATHAAGLVIGDRPLDQLIPLYRDPRSDMPVTQYDMKYAEAAGLVKFDFLGLRTLSILREARRLLALEGIEVDFDKLAWDDKASYDLLCRADTIGVFQLESEGMRNTLSMVKPTSFGDIIALVALYRPGPMDNIPLFAQRKNGQQPIDSPHPLLEEILAETYGIFVYQEQVMQAAQLLAGYSLGQADLLRRAMGKKIQSEMDAQREHFVKGCKEHNNISASQAGKLFDIIDKFAGYGFNKSHAAAYALLAYQTAWLKVHYPPVFYAAAMQYESHNTDRLALFVDDMRRRGIVLAPPSVNRGEAGFSVEPSAETSGSEVSAGGAAKQSVRYALGALKGIGGKAMSALVAERERGGAFASLEDLASRIDPQLLGRRTIEVLAASGALDSFGTDRATLYAHADHLAAAAHQAHEARTSGQSALFAANSKAAAIQWSQAPAWSASQLMEKEKEAFGFYFSSHPLQQYAPLLEFYRARDYAGLRAMVSQSAPRRANGDASASSRTNAMLAGLVEKLRWRQTKRGKRFAVVTLSDASGQYEAQCFIDNSARQETIRKLESLAEEAGCALLKVEADVGHGEDSNLRVTIQSAQSLAELARSAAWTVRCRVTQAEAFGELAQLLKETDTAKGRVVAMLANGANGSTEAGHGVLAMELGRKFVIDTDIAAQIEKIHGLSEVALSLDPKQPR